MHNGGEKDVYITRNTSEKYRAECLRPRFARPAPGVHVQGAHCGDQRMPLQVLDRGSGPKGGMTGEDYIAWVAPGLVNFVRAQQEHVGDAGEVILILDGSPIHRSKVVQDYFRFWKVPLVD